MLFQLNMYRLTESGFRFDLIHTENLWVFGIDICKFAVHLDRFHLVIYKQKVEAIVNML